MKRKLLYTAISILFLTGLNSCRFTTNIHPYLHHSFTIDPRPSEFRFDLIGNMIIMKVKVDDFDTLYNFLFDTGAFTIIDKTLADELGITSEQTTIVRGSTGASGFTGLTRIEKMTVGETVVFSVGAGIIDLSDIGSSLGIDLHGIIGNNFFDGFTITWNYVNETFRIDTVHNPVEDGIVFNFRQDLLTSNAPRITTMIDKITAVDMIFDTGFDGLISLPVNLIGRLQYDTTRLLKATGAMTGGLFGNSPADWLIKPQYLQLGPMKFKDIVCTSNHMDVGLIGGALLKMTETTIIYPERKLIMRPLNNFSMKQSYFGTGIGGYKDNNGNITISGIWPGSPAAKAGIRPGDEITEVNDTPVKERHEMWFWYINTDKEVNPLKLKIVRRGASEEMFLIHKEHILKNIYEPVQEDNVE
jgi:predicted aspartyl protease